MGMRDEVIRIANWWAAPGQYKPQPDELVGFFQGAGCEAAPSLGEAKLALDTYQYGVNVQGARKHWCGIFACSVLAFVGIDVRWTLMSGNMLGPGVTKIWGNQGITPGDVAVINQGVHHFIITDIDYGNNSLSAVDGNTQNEYIRNTTKQITYSGAAAAKTIVAYYRVNA